MERKDFEKLAELSMIDSDDIQIDEIKEEMEELLESLKCIKNIEVCGGNTHERRTRIQELERKKEEIKIEEVNDHVKEGMVVIKRTVGE